MSETALFDRLFIGDGEYVRADTAINTVGALNAEIASLRAQLDTSQLSNKLHLQAIETLRTQHNDEVQRCAGLTSQLDEARRKAVAELIAIVAAFENPYVPPSDPPYGKGFIEGQNSTVTEIVKSFRALLSESKT